VVTCSVGDTALMQGFWFFRIYIHLVLVILFIVCLNGGPLEQIETKQLLKQRILLRIHRRKNSIEYLALVSSMSHAQSDHFFNTKIY
jgi:hypothetical protein